MRTEITCGTFHKIVETPPGIDFVGVSVRRGNSNYSTICFDDPEIGIYRTDESIAVDDATMVILHDYHVPETMADILAEFHAFAGMVFVEIEDKDFHLIQTI